MRAFLRDKNSFVVISPVPSVDVMQGLILHLKEPNKGYLEPRMTGDIKAGVVRYDIPEELRANVIRVELNDNTGT